MRSTFNILYYIDRRRVKADGTTSILCRISIDARNAVVNTGICCIPETWDARKGETNNIRTNRQLAEFCKQVKELYDEQVRTQGVVSARIIKNLLDNKVARPITLLAMGEWERKRLLAHSEVVKSRSRYSASKSYQDYLRDFIISKGREDWSLTDVTAEFGNEYKTYLKQRKALGPTQTNHILRWLNRLVYIGVDMEIIRFNPLEEMEYYKKSETKQKYVALDDVRKLLALRMDSERGELIRRCFIFSMFTGLAYADAVQLHPRHIGKTADGRKYLRISRKKTNVEAFVPLHPIAERILSLYNTTDDTRPVFPLPGRDQAWCYLQEIGFAIGRRESLSPHQARHTFGTMLVSKGICVESIAKMMGHSSIRSTQIYAKITDENISKDMDKLMKRRKEKGLSTTDRQTSVLLECSSL
ncbi:MAG: site-specific integrase [Prevotella sp.]|nr:site-specific integrase [Prevotella sp.]